MRYGNLKHGLCEVDGDSRMLHLDSSLPWPSRGRFNVGTMMPHRQEESIPSLHPSAPTDESGDSKQL
jgi:hypothetical protein